MCSWFSDFLKDKNLPHNLLLIEAGTCILGWDFLPVLLFIKWDLDVGDMITYED